MAGEIGGAASGLASLARIALVSQVRVHAESVAARLRTLERLRNVTLARVEDCTQSQLERQRPALLLIDSSSVSVIPLVDALGVAGSVTVAGLALKLVAYGLAEGDEESILEFASLGALGFVLCDATFDELAKTAVDVLDGEVRCPPKVAETLLRHFGNSARIRARLDVLSPLSVREREALLLAIAKQDNKQIAARMGIEVTTVRTELHNAYRKLGVSGRDDATKLVRFGVAIED